MTAGVWASVALLAVVGVESVAGWGSAAQALLVSDLVRLPITVLTAGLGWWLIHRGTLPRRERGAWVLIEVAFGAQVLAHGASLLQQLQPGSGRFPSAADYLYAAAIPFVVAGLLLLPTAPRSRAERLRLLIDSMTVIVGAAMLMWYVAIAPLVRIPRADLEVIAFSTAVPMLDLLQLFVLIMLLLRRSEIGAAVGLLSGSVALKVVADSVYTIAYVQFGVAFGPGSWPFLLWALADLFALLAVRRRLRQRADPVGERHTRRRVSWLPYATIGLAYGMLAFVGREESLYTLGGMIAGTTLLTSLVIARQLLAQRENRRLAVLDPLTGLANRALLTERLAAMTRQPVRHGQCDAVLLIDLDHFKPINDAYGHEAGDAVLTAVAIALRAAIRSGDTAGRLGGDEFAVLLPGLPSRAAAEGVAQRLVEALRTPVIFDDRVLSVEASIGVAFRDAGVKDAEHLLAHADVAMYEVKRDGRGSYCVYAPELDRRARDLELRQAVGRDELVVHFQPVVGLHGDDHRGVEALVRWNHPVRGLLMPGAFIDLAEETGAIVAIGEWVLRESCRRLARWQAEHPQAEPVWLSVNLSARQIMQPELVDTVRQILAETGFPGERLVLELTESVVLQPDAQVVARLEALREMGIGIAVDDFGTGYAALSYLGKLPVSVMKIDRSFITGIDTDPDAYAVTDALIRLGKAYKLRVVAEGIETAGQRECLVRMGCEFGQGYYFARPMPSPDLDKYLARDASASQARPSA